MPEKHQQTLMPLAGQILTDYDTTRLVQSKEKAALRIRYQETGMHMCYFYNYKISQLTHST